MKNSTQPNTMGLINSSSSILGCFTRSFDKHHTDKMHLISSVLYIDNLSTINIINLKNIMNEKMNEIDRINIFIVFNDIENDNPEKQLKIEQSGNVTLVYTTLSYLIGQLSFNKSKDLTFFKCFGSNNTTHKNFDHLYSESLFIFCNLTWSNVVLSFKLSGLNISGGTISKRHILDSVHYQLIRYINLLGIGEDQMKKIIYDSSRNPILSQSIPIDFYVFMLQQYSIIKNMNKTAFLTYLNNIEDKKFKYYGKIFIDNSDKNDFIKNIMKFIKINFTLSMNSLIESIQNNFTYKIEQLENQIGKLESDYNSNVNVLEYNDDLVNGLISYSSNNEKKKLKKERKELKAQNVNGLADSLKTKNKYLSEQIIKLNNEMMLIKKEKDQFIEKKDNMSITELNNLESKEIILKHGGSN